EGKKYKLTYVSNGGTTYADEWYVEDVVVSLTYVPKREGYTFTGWHADEDLKNKIEKIKMTSDKTVYAGWKKTDVPTDLNGDDHFAYIVGYPDGSVMPEAQIKRSEVATIFFRLLKDDIREQYLDTENSFNDVDDTKWYNTAISTLENLGIIDGYADGGFHPENPITRAEFTAMAARFDRRNAGVEADFSDISGHWASEEISKAAENGWVDGYSDGTFLPDAKIKRCEAMAIVNRVLGRLPQSKDDLLPNMVTWPDNMNESKWFYLHVQEATNSHDCEHRADGSEYWTVLTEVPDWERYER
ncbi:MAG: S-layer homology domain-containing protein, partial [Firmicutes bacterium]|nr:S-layer homology domain-containing protein [Bacillota bacterium]